MVGGGQEGEIAEWIGIEVGWMHKGREEWPDVDR
jgi:hypothetical protein